MRSNVRAVGQICPARGRRKKLPPRRPHRATFAARPEVSANAHHCKGNRAQRNKPSADADSHPPSTACYPESRQQHPQDCCSGALGYTTLFCEPAHPCTGHATGISMALSIIIIISLVAFVSGSAYGIFSAIAPSADTIAVQQSVETLTAEYRDRLEEISDTVQHDRQDITTNDDVYYIRW